MGDGFVGPYHDEPFIPRISCQGCGDSWPLGKNIEAHDCTTAEDRDQRAASLRESRAYLWQTPRPIADR